MFKVQNSFIERTKDDDENNIQEYGTTNSPRDLGVSGPKITDEKTNINSLESVLSEFVTSELKKRTFHVCK